MLLHQDKDELDLVAPMVLVSLGQPAIFSGVLRSQSGAIVWRTSFHGATAGCCLAALPPPAQTCNSAMNVPMLHRRVHVALTRDSWDGNINKAY
jgi:hypothetical protein